ncbi:hypothetical protein GWK08_05430 [Leptobacterium flavescens]|uniref:Uncharacterized protein n=1 Tax=Leptobacterium flavescens TaxID=472055 RepID=A0A6P0UHP9_9FLAO|nr:hypothetical protein [Leptobacterium flavescens]NER12871.1 hypothetical protein [Leptobacterium flavescens]
MGVVQCDVHGEQSFLEVCKHIYAEYEKGIISEMYDFPVLSVKICKNCFENLDLEGIRDLKIDNLLNDLPDDIDVIEDEISKRYDKIDRRIICFRCYDELKKKV